MILSFFGIYIQRLHSAQNWPTEYRNIIVDVSRFYVYLYTEQFILSSLYSNTNFLSANQSIINYFYYFE